MNMKIVLGGPFLSLVPAPQRATHGLLILLLTALLQVATPSLVRRWIHFPWCGCWHPVWCYYTVLCREVRFSPWLIACGAVLHTLCSWGKWGRRREWREMRRWLAKRTFEDVLLNSELVAKLELSTLETSEKLYFRGFSSELMTVFRKTSAGLWTLNIQTLT